MLDLRKIDPPPAGFGNCATCPHRDVGAAAVCFACASAGMEPLADDRCDVCDQALQGGVCWNYWCRHDDRCFDYIWAIAVRSGVLERAINRYKFGNAYGWASIFGRVLVGYLDNNAPAFWDYDHIAATPAYTGPGARRSWSHSQLVIDKANVEAAGRWPFHVGSPPLIEKTAETQQMSKLAVADRRRVAVEELRPTLRVPNPDLVAGKSVLIYDDIFTDGSTLREVARALKEAGAARVAQVVLARQPWGS